MITSFKTFFVAQRLITFLKPLFSNSFQFAIFFVLILFSVDVKADVGCLVNNVIYTDYLGDASPYHPSNPAKKYYSNLGNSATIYYGSANDGYHCGFVNVYPASNYWDGHQNVPIEAQNEITSRESGGCVISSSLGGTPQGGDGDFVTFSMNNASYCSTPPNNLPFDDHLNFIVLAMAGLGAYFISSKGKLVF